MGALGAGSFERAERGEGSSGLVSFQGSNVSKVNSFPGEKHYMQFPPESRGARCIFSMQLEEGPSTCHEKVAIFGLPHDEEQRLPDRAVKIRRADTPHTEHGNPDRLCEYRRHYPEHP